MDLQGEIFTFILIVIGCAFLLAYVSGEREGLILETPYKLGESLNGIKGLDIETEQKVVEERLKQLKENGATNEYITLAMKDLGLERYIISKA